MAPQYYIRVKDSGGVDKAVVTDMLSLSYTKQVNAPGLCEFVLNGEHPATAYLDIDSDVDAQIEVWRRDPAQDIDWYIDFYGLYRYTRQYSKDGQDYFVARCPGQMSILGRRIVAWPAGTSNTSEFTSAKAETIMKTLVDANIGPSSSHLINGRQRSGFVYTIASATDAAGGNTISWSCAWKPLLEQLQAIARIGGGDFDLVKTGGTEWEFRFYSGQLGTDRSATVTFSLEYGNMGDPVYEKDRINEKTVALVGGQGDGADREIVERQGTDFAFDTDDIEVFVDGRNEDATAKLEAKGDAAIEKYRARNEFSYTVLQTPSSLYGKHYFLGDLVKARYKSIEVTQQVYAVTVKFDGKDGSEDIKVEMRDQ